MSNNCKSIDYIVDEIMNGEYTKDTLSEDSLELTGEFEALYFSNLRRNMQSDMARVVMKNFQDTRELDLYKSILKI